MAKYKAERITYKDQDKLMGKFCEVLENLKDKNQIQDFLKDLLNRQERIMLIRRLLIAEMLENKKTYAEIINKLKCSSETISKVCRWLNFGRGGYKKAINIITKK